MSADIDRPVHDSETHSREHGMMEGVKFSPCLLQELEGDRLLAFLLLLRRSSAPNVMNKEFFVPRA